MDCRSRSVRASRNSPATCPHTTQTDTHLNHRVDNKDEGGAKTAPETPDAVLLDNLLDGLDGRGRLAVLAVSDGTGGLVRLDSPDRAGHKGGDRAYMLAMCCDGDLRLGAVEWSGGGQRGSRTPHTHLTHCRLQDILTSDQASNDTLSGGQSASSSRVGGAAADNGRPRLLVECCISSA